MAARQGSGWPWLESGPAVTRAWNGSLVLWLARLLRPEKGRMSVVSCRQPEQRTFIKRKDLSGSTNRRREHAARLQKMYRGGGSVHCDDNDNTTILAALLRWRSAAWNRHNENAQHNAILPVRSKRCSCTVKESQVLMEFSTYSRRKLSMSLA